MTQSAEFSNFITYCPKPSPNPSELMRFFVVLFIYHPSIVLLSRTGVSKSPLVIRLPRFSGDMTVRITCFSISGNFSLSKSRWILTLYSFSEICFGISKVISRAVSSCGLRLNCKGFCSGHDSGKFIAMFPDRSKL